MNMELRRDADEIVRASIAAVLPDAAVQRTLKDYNPGTGRTLLVAVGKAAWQMARAALDTLGHVDDGVFERCWLPLERLVADAKCGIDVTTLVHAWLATAFRRIRIFDKSEIYGLFKNRLHNEFGDDMEALLNDVSAYARQLFDDDELRAEDLADAERWVAGKPKELISEYKMFGD